MSRFGRSYGNILTAQTLARSATNVVDWWAILSPVANMRESCAVFRALMLAGNVARPVPLHQIVPHAACRETVEELWKLRNAKR